VADTPIVEIARLSRTLEFSVSGTVAIVDGFTNGGSGATITDDGDLSVHEPSTLQDHSQLVVATQPVVLVPSTRMRLLRANKATTVDKASTVTGTVTIGSASTLTGTVKIGGRSVRWNQCY